MPWLYLILAGLFEVGWAISLKYSEGFSRTGPTIVTVVTAFISLALLGLAVKTIPVGTGYAVWTGIGTVGTAIFGMIVLGESTSAMRIGCIALIVLGIVGLKMAGE